MKSKINILIIILGLQVGLKAQNIDGLWKEVYMNPIKSYFKFDSLTSTFKYYYYDDLIGSFGKGIYKIEKNQIILEFDSINCDKPIIEYFDNKMSDTTNIALFHYWGSPKKVDVLVNGKQVYSNWTQSIDALFEDYLFIKIPQKLDNVEIVISDMNGSIYKEVTRFKLRLFNKPYCNVYYYPYDDWYKYEKSHEHVLKLKWIEHNFFETKGNVLNGFKKVK